MAEPLAELLELVQPSERGRKVADPMDMGEPQEELLELVQLPDSRTSERGRKVVSIVGVGGLGKTLLATLVYEEDRPAPPTLRAWVNAAAKDPKNILREILKQLGIPVNSVETQADNLRELGKRLLECLHDKRYFIVIDDMQSEEQWNSMNDAFPKNKNGGGTIMVTTTIQSVADACSSHDGYVYKLSPLHMAKSIDLFLRNRNENWKDNLAEGNVSDVLKKCDGLPLAIVSMSESLQCNVVLTETLLKDAWKELGANLVKQDGSFKRLRWVLMNKYTGLSGYNLRACLLYFCMYKHHMGAVPKRNSLIRRWEAEGFLVEENTTRRPTDVGAKNLKTLVDRNIIQPIIPGRDGAARRCQPRGMMLEYISQVSMSENFAALVSEATEMGANGIRRLSFHAGSPADEMKILKMELSIVLTLAVSGKGCDAILNFEKYQLISVLDLKECENLEPGHVEYICKLVLLKYLSLGDTIEAIPKGIKGLQLLETLEVSRNNTVKVYREVFELPNLKHLLGNFKLREESDGTLTKFLEEDSGLETVTGYLTGTTEGRIPMLMCHMMRVRKMKIYCHAEPHPTDKQYLQTAVKKFIRRGKDTYRPDNSCSLSIVLKNSTKRKWSPPLEFLQCPGSLGSLKLRGDWSRFQLPTVTVPVTGEQSVPTVAPGPFTTITGITKLCLSDTYKGGQEILDALTHMTALEYLKLNETVLKAITIKAGIFQSLVSLFLVGRTMDEGITIQQDALPSLVSLHLISKDPILKVEGYQVQLPMTHSEHNQVQLPDGCLPCLHEIALGPLDKSSEKVKAWKGAAKGHPNRPVVLILDA